jgi:hypothetical protein
LFEPWGENAAAIEIADEFRAGKQSTKEVIRKHKNEKKE